MNSPRLVSLAIVPVAVASVLLAGCSPTPEATPTPTPAFASEEEAFAAAEETYRAYEEASNSTDLTKPETFEPVFEWLLDEAEAAARENYSEFHAYGVNRSGSSTFDSFTPVRFDGETVTARLCLDVSEVQLVDDTGASVVPADRPPRQPIEAQFSTTQTPTGLGISSTTPTKDIEC